MDERYKNFSWDYYSLDRPRKVENGIKARSERGTIGETWWSRRWLQALEDLGMGSRLARGRLYARQGQVLSIEIEQGHVLAKVQGSLREPYRVDISIEVISKVAWERVTAVLAKRALFAAKLLANEMPTTIEEAFQEVSLSLFPSAEQDLRTRCSCPDWANPCKHSAAVYYILADRFDEDPFLLFKLRGCPKEKLLAAIKQKRLGTAQAQLVQPVGAVSNAQNPPEAALRLEDRIDTFWQCAEPLEHFAIQPHSATVKQAMLKRLGPLPSVSGQQQLADRLAHFYEQTEAAALARLDDEPL